MQLTAFVVGFLVRIGVGALKTFHWNVFKGLLFLTTLDPHRNTAQGVSLSADGD